jgi:hypothetical protein
MFGTMVPAAVEAAFSGGAPSVRALIERPPKR